MKKTVYKNGIALLFYIFFTTPILSPSIGGLTIYLHWLIPLLDIDFLKEILRFKIKKSQLFIVGIFIVACIILKRWKVALDVILLIETLLYLLYSYKNGTFKYLYWGVNFNIVIAIIQFILYYCVSPSAALSIAPRKCCKSNMG